MQIQTSQLHTPATLNWLRGSTPATQDGANAYDPNGTSPASPSPPTTGTKSSLLSSDTAGHVIQSAQQTGSTSSILSAGEKGRLDDIAHDATFAAQQTAMFSSSTDLASIDASQFPKNGESASVWTAFTQKMEAISSQAQSVQQQRQAIYKGETAQGTPPAQIYADLLKFNANLPQSYGDSLDQSQTKSAGSWNAWNQAQSAYLQQAIDQANGTSASSQTLPSTPSAATASATATG